MGWGKYMEDDISRRNGTSRAQAEMRREAERRAREVAAAAIVTREPGEEPMNEKTEFTATTARPLPVLVLADVSGSMNKPDKIGALNHAIKFACGP